MAEKDVQDWKDRFQQRWRATGVLAGSDELKALTFYKLGYDDGVEDARVVLANMAKERGLVD